MGHPKRIRKKYDKPTHPWQKLRIEEERKLRKDYGLKSKREIWKAETKLRNIRRQARLLLARVDEQAKVESEQLINRIVRFGMSGAGIHLEDVLSLSLRDILKRRLQTLVTTKGFANTPDQARQFITHGHIWLNNRKVTIPSYLVPIEEEDQISFNQYSAIADESHPARIQPEKEEISEEITEEVQEENGGKE